jgi:hypothetical protein
MVDEEEKDKKSPEKDLGRRGFFFTVMGGALAAIAGWITGFFPRNGKDENTNVNISSLEARITALETKVAEQNNILARIKDTQPIAELQGNNELVVFNKKELTVIDENPDAAVFLNLVSTHGGVGIRFYKGFGFGNEQVTNPWSIWIEGLEGYQNLAIIRDWRFTAALWDQDGKLLVGRLDPYPPGNQPAKARFDVRGTIDEVQAVVEGSIDQTADIFQVAAGNGMLHFIVNGAGRVVIGSPEEPKDLILHDTATGSPYSFRVINGQLNLSKIS